MSRFSYLEESYSVSTVSSLATTILIPSLHIYYVPTIFFVFLICLFNQTHNKLALISTLCLNACNSMHAVVYFILGWIIVREIG